MFRSIIVNLSVSSAQSFNPITSELTDLFTRLLILYRVMMLYCAGVIDRLLPLVAVNGIEQEHRGGQALRWRAGIGYILDYTN